MDRFPLGYNTYSIRALRWHDLQLIDYAGSLKLDAIFLQDSIDPGINDPAHWKAVKDAAARAGLWLGTGGSAVLPRDESDFDHSVKLLRDGIKRAVGMGSPLVRMLLAGDRDHLPPGPPAKHIETMIKVLRVVRSEAMDAGVKFAIENHKDLLCWETRQVIDGAGKEFVGSYLDTGNPVFVMEDPMETVETLGPRGGDAASARLGGLRIARRHRRAMGAARRGRRGFQSHRRQSQRDLPAASRSTTSPSPAVRPQILPVWDPEFMKR